MGTSSPATIPSTASSMAIALASKLQSSPVPTGLDLHLRCAFAGAICCSITHGALIPVEVIKTTIQSNPHTYHGGMLSVARKLVAAEGPAALLKGFGPTIAGYFAQGAFKIGGYEFFKSTLIRLLGPDRAADYRPHIYLASSAAAEFVADTFLCPLEATRTRLSMQPGFARGLAPAFARLVREEGVRRGLYAGFGPMLLKQLPYNMTKFLVYEMAAESVYGTIVTPPREELPVPVVTAINLWSGLAAGVCAAVVSQPFDALVSKISKQKASPGESVVGRLVKTVVEVGPRGLFAGMGTRIAMAGTMTALQFAIYGNIKRMLGATGGIQINRRED
ncbi:mitochondrial phosphate carrier protein [Phlyctochytrium bullatum]|nr:mitochondrial phosphate carrier protein [Phlyctochytrium bullatum]